VRLYEVFTDAAGSDSTTSVQTGRCDSTASVQTGRCDSTASVQTGRCDRATSVQTGRYLLRLPTVRTGISCRTGRHVLPTRAATDTCFRLDVFFGSPTYLGQVLTCRYEECRFRQRG